VGDELTPEEAVLGACMLDEKVIRFAVQHVMPSDFYFWQGEEIFSAILALHSTQQPVDVVSVAAKLADSGSRVQAHELHRLIEQVPTAANVEFYAAEVREAATRRRLQAVATELAQTAANEALPPGEALARALQALKEARDDAPTTGVRAKTLAEIMAEKDSYDWIIKGLFERGDRMMLTGPPGKGKSTLTRMIAVFAAAGIHPFQLTPIDPVKVLVVDRENSERQWRRKARTLYQQAQALGRGKLVQDMRLVCEQKALDLATDRDLGMVHRLIDEEAPELLVIGPLYRLAPRALQTDSEAAPILAALDSLRDRGCALLIEAHAVKDKNGSLSPRGSAALEGWPEFGRGLSQDIANPARWELQAWRGDRDERDIPDALLRGGPVPWMAEGISEAVLQRFRTYDEPERLAF
jgi:AAA domain/DnaB-like helicase N terminal domain